MAKKGNGTLSAATTIEDLKRELASENMSNYSSFSKFSSAKGGNLVEVRRLKSLDKKIMSRTSERSITAFKIGEP